MDKTDIIALMAAQIYAHAPSDLREYREKAVCDAWRIYAEVERTKDPWLKSQPIGTPED